MAGEIIKGTVQSNIIAVKGSTVGIVSDADGQKNFNEVAAYDFDTDTPTVLSKLDGSNVINSTTPKLAVEQGKQFVTTQITFDANITAVNVEAIIRDRIDQWIATTNSARYDDFQVIINPSGLGNHDITIVINRYY